ncbi:uncharacterized protein K441DRAFT_736942 [Cenococcum geophilum 1.58]|uniref:uncharacterized protein n=1 Tax=Cenococcum geophilum 1.58 TaxID=794803 RepID=UPI00358EB324|nr:hypothetical protein K441DRAFT_736942 [Cenococcum geophilum 1.58]
MGKEEEYVIFRRFSSFNARNVLYLQGELIALEERLETIDGNLQKAGERDALKSRDSFYRDSERKQLVLEIRRLLADYNSAVLQWSQIQDVPPLAARHVQGFKRWMRHANSIVDNSMNYTEKKKPSGEVGVLGGTQGGGVLDLLSLNKEADSWIGRFLRHSWLKFFFIRDMLYLNDRIEAFIFYNSMAIDTIVTGTAVLCAILLTVMGTVALNAES